MGILDVFHTYIFFYALLNITVKYYFIVTQLLPTQVIYSLQRLTALQTQNLYIGPQTESGLSHLKTPGLSSLCPGTEAKPDPIKGGLQVTSFFTYNCLAVSLFENEEHFLQRQLQTKVAD